MSSGGAPYGVLNQENPPIILLEGADCVGKTTAIRRLQDLIPSHDLMKLSAAPGQKDNQYMRSVYTASTVLFHNSPRNTWLVDRYTPSERVYGTMFRGLTRDQSTHLDWAEEEMSRRNGHIFLLKVDKHTMERRLNQKREAFPNERHGDIDLLWKIQQMYDMIVREDVRIKQKWYVEACATPEEIALGILVATGMHPGPMPMLLGMAVVRRIS